MIKGIGVDLVKVSRVAASYDRFGIKFAAKILAPDELSLLDKVVNKVGFLAKRFAAKEAVSKALGTGMRQGVHFAQIIVKNHPSGAPYIELVGRAQDVALALGVSSINLSISDEVDAAIAFVVFEGD